MIRVDFYLLTDSSQEARQLFACRLAEKAYQKKHQIYILVNSMAAAEQLDQLLWTFQDDSFLPHEIYSQNTPLSAPIQIGTSGYPATCDTLFNLTSALPDNIEHFSRIIEIVPNNENERQQARDRFRLYRQKGYSLQTHNI